MATTFQKQVKEAIYNEMHNANIICHKDGTVSAKRSYFYHTQTADQWSEKVAAVLKTAGIAAYVSGEDNYAQWPKTSYLTARISAK